MNAAVRCPRCGAAIELPIGLGTRYVHDAGGASYVTATVRAGKTPHVCPTLAAPWVVADE